MFLHLCVILFMGGGCLPTPGCSLPGLGRPPMVGQTPQIQTPQLGRLPWMQTPQGWADPPDSDPSVGKTPLDADLLGLGRPPWMQTPQGLGRPPWMQTPLGLGRPPRGLADPLDADPPDWTDPPGCRPPGVGQTPPDTVYKLAVRILLEYILVLLLRHLGYFNLRIVTEMRKHNQQYCRRAAWQYWE